MFSALETALYTILSADVNLQTLVDERIFADQAPPAIELPYVVISRGQGGYVQDSPRLAMDVTYHVEAIATVRADAQAIAELCHTILNERTLTITGWSHYATNGQDWQSRVVNQDGTQFYQVGAVYRIRADKI